MMLARAVAVWALLLLLAILNGGVRQAMITPRLGERAGHIVSTGLLCAIILAVAWGSIRWIGADGTRACLGVGLLWSALTVAFEFLGGHYLFGAPWPTLLADYNLARGRVWILVPVVNLIAPLIAARARGL